MADFSPGRASVRPLALLGESLPGGWRRASTIQNESTTERRIIADQLLGQVLKTLACPEVNRVVVTETLSLLTELNTRATRIDLNPTAASSILRRVLELSDSTRTDQAGSFLLPQALAFSSNYTMQHPFVCWRRIQRAVERQDEPPTSVLDKRFRWVFALSEKNLGPRGDRHVSSTATNQNPEAPQPTDRTIQDGSAISHDGAIRSYPLAESRLIELEKRVSEILIKKFGFPKPYDEVCNDEVRGRVEVCEIAGPEYVKKIVEELYQHLKNHQIDHQLISIRDRPGKFHFVYIRERSESDRK